MSTKTEHIVNGVKFTPTTKIEFTDNPKQPHSKAHARYAIYQKAKTWGEYLKLNQGGYAMIDARYDFGKGFLRVLSPAISAQTKLKLRDRELTAEVLTRKARITLTCLETQDQVLCGPNNVTSDDLEIACVKGLSDGGTWQIPAWEIQCEIESNDNGSVIRFRFADGEPILGFEFLSR